MTENKVRILTVINQYYPFQGGAENVARFLVENTNDDEYAHDVLTIASNSMVALINDPDEVDQQIIKSVDSSYKIYRFRLFKFKGREKNGRIFRYLTLLKYIVWMIKLKNNYDVIHAHTYYWPATAAVIAGHLLGKPVVVTGHSRISRLVAEINMGEFPRLLLRALRGTNKYVAISNKIQAEAKSLCKLDPRKIVLLYNGINTNKYRPCASENMKQLMRQEMGLPKDKTIIVYHGRIEENKNLRTLLHAVSRCPDQNIFFLLIGEGSCKQEITGCIQEFGLLDDVQILGFKKNIAEYLRASDIYCLPSHLEGFSLALLEAMASGLICLASDIEGNRDAITNEINGYLFDSHSVDQLEQLLEKVVSGISDDDRDRLGVAARNTVVDRFSLTAMLENYKSLYRNLAGHSSSSSVH
jgi:glycosyltransferase involved in cell wall biosynthesis